MKESCFKPRVYLIKTRKIGFARILLTLFFSLFAPAAFAQTTAFTYQGKLTDAGNPANSNYDLQFKLFDTVTVGTGIQQGATLVRNPVTVGAGIFTVTLDFGANVFNGTDRFLEIGVRPAGSANPYTTLAPRQPITSSPYAIQTLNAQQLGGLPASGFVQNTTTAQAGANFNVGGTGTVGNLNINNTVIESLEKRLAEVGRNSELRPELRRQLKAERKPTKPENAQQAKL